MDSTIPQAFLPTRTGATTISRANKDKTDWAAVLTVLILAISGAAAGAFVYAPMRWPARISPALHCVGAAIGMMVFLFPGTLIVHMTIKFANLLGRRLHKDSDNI